MSTVQEAPTPTTDERASLPSASSAGRYAACPGSFMLEQQAPPGTTSADAAIGNRVHAALAGEIATVDLSDDEQRLVELCTEQEVALLRDTFGAVLVGSIRERRLWALDDDFNRAWSGKPDVVLLANGRALVIDYKTGRGAVEPAEGNMQLRALAVLVAEQFGPQSVTVAIIQPLAGKPSVCHYNAEALKQATAEIGYTMARIKLPNQPRNPSPGACKYCRAKEICPEARGEVTKLPELAKRDGRELVMSPAEIADFLARAKVVEDVIESVRAKAKRVLEDGGEIPGWSLKPGAVRESITKPETVFGRFIQAGGTSEQFMPAVKLTKSELKAAVKVATGAKGKELDAKVDAMLDGCTEAKQAAASLVQEKGAA
jgi:CRISPR/Cas system-associated exonuclease Cas4 (RecB family)